MGGPLIQHATSRRLSVLTRIPWRTRDYSTTLPVDVDLLERYRGLVALGRIQQDEEQVRMVIQLRRLQKELEGYAPPAILSRHLNHTHAVTNNPPALTSSKDSADSGPWWAANEDTSDVEPDSQGLIRIRTHAEEIEALTTPKGLLITGPPGSGKSFLIDLWFSTVPTPYKARKHYNELVLEIYRAVWEEARRRMAAMHSSEVLPGRAADSEPAQPWSKAVREQWRQLLNTGSLPIRWRRKSNMAFSLSRTPLEPSIAYVVAQRLILRHWLLVFDEIQLLDVSSATLLADVLSWFWRMGGIIVGSSNKVPDDLYKNGVQRERLEPFVEALKARCPVVLMRSERDWRAVRGSQGKRSWYTFAQQAEFEAAQAEFRHGAHAPPEGAEEVVRFSDRSEAKVSMAEDSAADIVVFGRRIHIPWSGDGVCQFAFMQLCDESLGPADYITLASRYHTFIVTSIPVLRLSAKNQARRFISLIDALYEARCRIVCLAEAPPEELFFPDAPVESGHADLRTQDDVDILMAEAVGETQDVYRPNVSSYDAPNMAEERVQEKTLSLDTLSIFSGKDEQFAFKRALSRLLEMTSEGYAQNEEWAPLPPSARKWETREPNPLLPANHPRPDRSSELSQYAAADTPDFAEEASLYATLPYATAIERPPPPQFSADHIWGVREDWGPRAQTWGRGASFYASLHEPEPAATHRPAAASDARVRAPDDEQGRPPESEPSSSESAQGSMFPSNRAHRRAGGDDGSR